MSSDPATDDDQRYLVVNGRRWRRSDPAIPEPLRAELVAELMAARREVGAAGRAGDDSAKAAARARVQDAKTALGERGTPWWEAVPPGGHTARIEAAIRTLLRHRAGTTICPSDAARVVGGERWRTLMPEVREVAFDLARDGALTVRQRGAEVTDFEALRGPIRLAASGGNEADAG